MADLKQIAERIFRETLAAIDIPATMRRKLAPSGSCIHVDGTDVDLNDYDRICAIAFGKASLAMAKGLVGVLPHKCHVEGILVTPGPSLESVPGFRMIGARHPVPDAGSLAAGREILDFLKATNERTLIFFLLSGGGSALVEHPLDPSATLADIQALNRLLVACGASIDQINSVRKHFSAVKGGRLAAAAPSAMKITLGVTDVPEGRESALASGPTLPDPTSVADACAVIERHGLVEKLPAVFRKYFDRPESMLESPKPGDHIFVRSVFQIILGRDDLFHPAHQAAQFEGFVTACDNATDDWPVTRATDYLLAQLADLKSAYPGRPVAVIADGEVSSPVTGDGVGGRNLAFVLDCMPKIAGQQVTVLSAGTDGIDGSSPAAGAVADGDSFARAKGMGLDPAEYFRRSDSYTFFKQLGDTIETGPTGNNLRDLRILLAK
jgi:glycerate 2-kinase